MTELMLLLKRHWKRHRLQTPFPLGTIKVKLQIFSVSCGNMSWMVRCTIRSTILFHRLLTIKRYVSVCRREENVFARLQSGHSYLTHSHLLRGEPNHISGFCRVAHFTVYVIDGF